MLLLSSNDLFFEINKEGKVISISKSLYDETMKDLENEGLKELWEARNKLANPNLTPKTYNPKPYKHPF